MSTSEYAWHRERRERIRRAHPEVTRLNGRDPSSGFYIVALGVIQLLIAMVVVDQPLGLVFVVALFVGTLPAHALGVLIHEASHNLITRGPRSNKIWAILANLTLIGPAGIEFRHQHLLHHRYLGEAGRRDTQAPSFREAEVVGNSSGKKLLSFTFGRFVFSNPEAPRPPWDGWLVLNWVACIGTGIAVVGCMSWSSFWYLAFSGLLAFGPSVVGARRLSEHLPVRVGQPTNSYYGPLNALSFNVGHHVEHHDFPGVAWRRLPRVRKLARDEYDSLFFFTSWTRLIVRYFLSPLYRVDHYVGMGQKLPAEEAERLSPAKGSHGEPHPA